MYLIDGGKCGDQDIAYVGGVHEVFESGSWGGRGMAD